MQHPDFELVMLVVAAFVGISNLFVFCYFGKLTTESSLKMADCVYDLDWYRFDNALSKCLIPIIQMGQRPLTYDGYGIFILDLETFTQVMHWECRIYRLQRRWQPLLLFIAAHLSSF